MEVGTLTARLQLVLTDFEKAMAQARSQLQQTEKQLKTFSDVGAKIASVGKSFSMYVTAPLAAAGGAAVKFAMDAVESENLFEVSMGNMAEAARAWSVELSRSLGLNQYEIRQVVGTFNVMFTSMGFGEQAAYNMARGLTQLAYDMASFYNLKPEEAFQKLQAAISGEIEPLRRLGITINETAIATYAYTHGIAQQGQELNEQQKVLARYGLIMEQTAKAQGDLARTIDSPTNQLRILKARLEETAVSFGQELLPALSGALQWLNRLAKGLQELDPETRRFIVGAAAVAAAIGPVLFGIGKLVGAVPTVVKGFQAIQTAAGLLGKALTFLTANPIGMAITAIGLLAAAAYYVYKHWDEIRPRLVAIWEVIRAGAESVGIRISRAWESVKLAVYRAIDGILDAVAPLIDWLPAAVTRGFDSLRASVERKIADVERNLDELSARAEANAARTAQAMDELGRAFQKPQKGIGDLRAAEADWEREHSATWNAAKQPVLDFDRLLATAAPSAAASMGKVAEATDRLSAALQALDINHKYWLATAGQSATEAEKAAAAQELLRQKMALVSQELEATKARLAEVAAAKGINSQAALALKERIVELSETYADLKRQAQAATEAMKEQIRFSVEAGKVTMEQTWVTPEGKKVTVVTPVPKPKKPETAEQKWEYIKKTYHAATPEVQRQLYKGLFGGEPPGLQYGAVINRMMYLLDPLRGGVWRVAERGPEAVVPLDRGGLFDPGALARAIAQHLKPSVHLETHVHSPEPLSPSEVARRNRQMLRELALEWGLV